MLTAKEKRFIKYWEEQRTGGRWPYFALYIPVGTFLCAVITAFLMSMISLVGTSFFLVVGITSAVLATTLTIYSWYNNEKRWKTIIRREINEGKSLDAQPSDDQVY